jgi:predicted phage-related endonuclease
MTKRKGVLVMSKATVAVEVVKAVKVVKVENTAVEIDAEMQKVINQFVTTRTMITELEKTKKELEAQIKAILGDAEVGVVNGEIRIEQSKRSRSGVDSKKLALAFPEAYEAVQTTTDYVVLVVK